MTSLSGGSYMIGSFQTFFSPPNDVEKRSSEIPLMKGVTGAVRVKNSVFDAINTISPVLAAKIIKYGLFFFYSSNIFDATIVVSRSVDYTNYTYDNIMSLTFRNKLYLKSFTNIGVSYLPTRLSSMSMLAIGGHEPGVSILNGQIRKIVSELVCSNGTILVAE